MSVTRLPSGSRRPAVRVLVAAAAATAALAATLLPAAEARDRVVAAATDPTGAPRLRLTDQDQVVEPDGTWHLHVQLDGTLPSEPTELVVTITNPYASPDPAKRPAKREVMRTSANGQLPTSAIGSPTRLPVTAAGALDVAVPVASTPQPAGSPKIRIRREGVYPVHVELQSGGDVLDSFVTWLVRLPTVAASANDGTLSVALVVPIGTAPVTAPGGGGTVSDPERQRLRTIVDGLAANRTVPVTLAPTPETLAALADSPLAQDQAVVTDLAAAVLSRQVLAAPYVHVDTAGLVRNGFGEELDRQIVAGEDALRRTLGLVRVDRETWLLPAGTDGATLAQLRTRNVNQLLARPDQVEDLVYGDRPSLWAQARSGDTTFPALFTIEPELTSALSPAADVNPVLAATRFLAELSATAMDLRLADGQARFPGGVALVPDTTWNPDPAFLRTTLQGLVANRLITPVPVDGLFSADLLALDGNGNPVVRPLRPADTTTVGKEEIDALAITRLRLASLETMVGTTDAALAAVRSRLLVGSGIDLPRAGRDAYRDAANQWADTLLTQVSSLVRSSDSFTITSRRDQLPLRFRNDTGRPVRVLLRLTSEKLGFPRGSEQLVELDKATTVFDVKVVPKAPNVFPLTIEVLSPDKSILLSRTTVKIRSTSIPGLGAILSIAALAIVAFWWLRHLRAVRARHRAAAKAIHPTGSAPSDNAESGPGSDATADDGALVSSVPSAATVETATRPEPPPAAPNPAPPTNDGGDR